MENIIVKLAERASKLSRATDKLRNELATAVESLDPLCKEAGINFEGKAFLERAADNYDWRWVASPDGIALRSELVEDASAPSEDTWVSRAPRKVLRHSVIALPEFLEDYAERLDQLGKEYTEAAEAAEKVKKALISGS